MKTKFNEIALRAVFSRYSLNNSIRIDLVTLDYGEPYCTVTVCTTLYTPNYNQILIKNYAENEGIEEALEGLGFVDYDTDEYIAVGFQTGLVGYLLLTKNEIEKLFKS